jgi:VWFA-related protein
MRTRRLLLLIALGLLFGSIFYELSSARPVAQAQQSAANPQSAAESQANAESQSSPDVIHVDTREVLVDSIVTDKKGNYLRDLTKQDFKVWEDGKEQAITSFSFEESTSSGPNQKPRYMVLFFDNSTMNAADQAQARIAAGKFIDANAGPDRLIAVTDFDGGLHISQDFTANVEWLKKAVENLRGSHVSPNAQVASLGPVPLGPNLGNAESDFGVRSVLLALRSLAKGLGAVPGRKNLVMLTSGFALNPEFQSELTAVIDSCNRANVAIYPIDVRGLVTPDMISPMVPHSRLAPRPIPSHSASLHLAAFHHQRSRSHKATLHLVAFPEPAVLEPQRTGGGGGGHGGGGTGGGGTGGGGHGGTGGGTTGGGTTGGGKTGGGGTTGGGTVSNTGLYNSYNQPRVIVPQFPSLASTNQQVLYELADGTGGFVIVNTNDLLGGLEKIAKDQNQYYLLGYKPANSAENSCHTLRVKVGRSGTTVRARTGYCNSRPVDFLAGNSIEKDLETRAAGEMKGNVSAMMQAPFFYTSPNTAQIHLALEIPSNALKFEKQKGKQHSALNILGIAYKPDSSMAARFSDTVNLDFADKKEVEEFQKRPFHYENQFGIASGQYKLRVVFSSGNETFGKVEMPLAVDPYRNQQFSISGLALSNNMHSANSIATDLDSQLLEDRTPLLVKGIQVVPSATNRFKKTDVAGLYAEIYEPLLKGPTPPAVAFEMRVVDPKTGQEKLSVREKAQVAAPGDPVIPIGLKLPVASLDPGAYRLTLRAAELLPNNTLGNVSATRTVDFVVE